MSPTPRWAALRQVILATLDLDADLAVARGALGLGPSFDDPQLADVGLRDATTPVGPDTYLELVAPIPADHRMAAWLTKVGGSAGFGLSVQVPDLDGVRERCSAAGVRITLDLEVEGHEIVQLHPVDLGVVLELDAYLPRSGWFWDGLPGNEAAQADRSRMVDDVRGVVVATPDPVALADRWAVVAGLERPRPAADGAVLDLDGRTVTFVPAGGGRTGLVAVELHAVDRTRAGTTVGVCRTELRLV